MKRLLLSFGVVVLLLVGVVQAAVIDFEKNGESTAPALVFNALPSDSNTVYDISPLPRVDLVAHENIGVDGSCGPGINSDLPHTNFAFAISVTDFR